MTSFPGVALKELYSHLPTSEAEVSTTPHPTPDSSCLHTEQTVILQAVSAQLQV